MKRMAIVCGLIGLVSLPPVAEATPQAHPGFQAWSRPAAPRASVLRPTGRPAVARLRGAGGLSTRQQARGLAGAIHRATDADSVANMAPRAWGPMTESLSADDGMRQMLQHSSPGAIRAAFPLAREGERRPASDTRESATRAEQAREGRLRVAFDRYEQAARGLQQVRDRARTGSPGPQRRSVQRAILAARTRLQAAHHAWRQAVSEVSSAHMHSAVANVIADVNAGRPTPGAAQPAVGR